MRDQNTTDKLIQSMRSAWTLIELTLVIVILGILSSIAIPKLAATRDDAKLSQDISNMATCIRDATAQYTATGTDLTASSSVVCNAVKCYDITYSINGLGFLVSIDAGAANYCSDIENIGGHLVGTYQFGGTSVSQ